MPNSGNSEIALLAYWAGNPTNVPLAELNIQKGTLVLDTSTPAIYQKTSTTDNSAFNLLAIGTGGTFTTPTINDPTIGGKVVESGIQTLTGAGAVDVTNAVTKLVTTGANALTLANGTNGQVKTITMITDGGDGTLTPTTKTGYSTITFNDAGDSVQLQYFTTAGWLCIANNGATLA